MSFLAELARVPSGAKKLRNPALNTAGVQIFRALVARGFLNMRRHSPGAGLAKDGMVSVPNFLSAGELAAVREEADRLAASDALSTYDRHGPSIVQRWDIRGLDVGEYPALASWVSDRRALDLTADGERRSLRAVDGTRMFERVMYEASDEHDRESDLHYDTFFSTHKLWLYLDDVELRNGPLVYVPGSHKVTRVRLRGDYAESRGKNTGSRRIHDDEVAKLGLEPRVLTCPANTLVIVNTCGYHCRSAGQPGNTRRALHMSFRFNPFMPHLVRAAEPLVRNRPRAARLLDLATKGE